MEIHVITGHLGSGKTEVAVNFAIRLFEQAQQADHAASVALVDVDVVNPYFAAREARALLESRGISVAAPSIQTTTADVPVLGNEVYRCLHREEGTVILDVGGDPKGARILSNLHEHLQGKLLQVYCVVNTKRPSTSTPDGILTYIRNINAASRLHITGLIHNTHLLHETVVEDIAHGQQLLEHVADQSGLPIVFTAVMKDLAPSLQGVKNDVLPMERYIKPPYE